jgi:hypothetical protein
MEKMPNKGNNVMGIRAVANIGTASVTHHMIIQEAAAITFQAWTSMGRGLGINCIAAKHKGPAKSP